MGTECPIRLMRKRILLIPLVVMFFTIGAQLRPAPPMLTGSELMKAKLVAAQKVLEGIATEDFNLVARNAELLQGYSRAATWMAQQSPEYARYTEDFRRHASALAGEARRRNVDGATVAYFQLTISCVNCHKLIRDR
jgi:cytochrome c556